MDALELAKQAKKRNIIDMTPQSFAIWLKNWKIFTGNRKQSRPLVALAGR
jgi:Neuraminidase (sialidase)